MSIEVLVEKFQCPGCVAGIDPATCRAYDPNPKTLDRSGQNGARCNGHVLGTSSLSYGPFALGLPKGFNRPQRIFSSRPQTVLDAFPDEMCIRLWPAGTHPSWDHLNVPVWALVQDGFLFVRTYAPRTGLGTAVDVIAGGTLELVPQAIDVSAFIDEID